MTKTSSSRIKAISTNTNPKNAYWITMTAIAIGFLVILFIMAPVAVYAELPMPSTEAYWAVGLLAAGFAALAVSCALCRTLKCGRTGIGNIL